VSSTDDISSKSQDIVWRAPRLIVVGAISLLFALGLIYTAASLIGEH
jgi:hypothetical protein